jgi:hypothetical protein
MQGEPLNMSFDRQHEAPFADPSASPLPLYPKRL